MSTEVPTDFNLIKLEQVGFIAGLRSEPLPDQITALEKQGMQLIVQEAVKKAISPTLAGLALRDLIPDIDFADQGGTRIQSKAWRQPWSGTYTHTSGEFEVYRTNKEVDYDKKIIGIWGARYVNTGPNHLGNVVSTSNIIFKDSAGNTYDSWQVEGLDTQDAMFAYTPIIFSNTRQLRIFHYPRVDKSGGFDNIQLLGKVAERKGDHVNGLQHFPMGPY